MQVGDIIQAQDDPVVTWEIKQIVVNCNNIELKVIEEWIDDGFSYPSIILDWEAKTIFKL
jgi:hypothetical protein